MEAEARCKAPESVQTALMLFEFNARQVDGDLTHSQARGREHMDESRATARGRFSRRVILAGLTLGAMSGTAWSVRASNFGSAGTVGDDYTAPIGPNGVWLIDDSSFVVGRLNLDAVRQTAVADALGSTSGGMMASPSDVVTSMPASNPAGSCTDAQFDACAFDDNYGNTGLCGWNQCVGTTTGSHPSQRCSLQYVRFDKPEADGTGCPAARGLACHELGHSVGLRHTNGIAGIPGGTCMIAGQGTATPNGFNSHDLAHLDANY